MSVQRLWLDVRHARFVVGDVGYWRFNDQDRIAMAGQDRTRFKEGVQPQAAIDLALTPSDKGVAVFQRWLREWAGGGPFRGGRRNAPLQGPQPAGPEDAPRWRLHCGHCPRCRRVLRLVDRLQRWSRTGSAAALAAAAAAGLSGHPGGGVVGLASAAALRWASQSAERGRALFFRSDVVIQTEEVYSL